MIMSSENREAQRDLRLTLKTQDQTLMRQAMEGAGLTRYGCWRERSKAVKHT